MKGEIIDAYSEGWVCSDQTPNEKERSATVKAVLFIGDSGEEHLGFIITVGQSGEPQESILLSAEDAYILRNVIDRGFNQTNRWLKEREKARKG